MKTLKNLRNTNKKQCFFAPKSVILHSNSWICFGGAPARGSQLPRARAPPTQKKNQRNWREKKTVFPLTNKGFGGTEIVFYCVFLRFFQGFWMTSLKNLRKANKKQSFCSHIHYSSTEERLFFEFLCFFLGGRSPDARKLSSVGQGSAPQKNRGDSNKNNFLMKNKRFWIKEWRLLVFLRISRFMKENLNNLRKTNRHNLFVQKSIIFVL